MLKIMINTFKLLIKNKSFIIMGIIAPAFIILFFTFSFGGEYNYNVGIINNDKNYISNEIINTIKNIENINIVDVDNNDYKMMLATEQIQIAVIINKNFSDNILNLKGDKIIIKSISNEELKSIITSIIQSKTEELSLISRISNKDIYKFKYINEKYKDNILNVNFNSIKDNRPSIDNSLGLIIIMIFITGSTIASFIIDDEENNTKLRIVVSRQNPYIYYISLLIVFYLLSCTTSCIYYIMCKILDLNFNMANTNNFLMVLLMINLVSVSLNLFIVSCTKSRYIANIVNILLVIPTCMVSGVFWDFDVMPNYLKKVGEFLPQRWIYVCLERLKIYDNLSYINEYLFLMLGISLLFFISSILCFKRRKNF